MKDKDNFVENILFIKIIVFILIIIKYSSLKSIILSLINYRDFDS